MGLNKRLFDKLKLKIDYFIEYVHYDCFWVFLLFILVIILILYLILCNFVSDGFLQFLCAYKLL